MFLSSIQRIKRGAAAPDQQGGWVFNQATSTWVRGKVIVRRVFSSQLGPLGSSSDYTYRYELVSADEVEPGDAIEALGCVLKVESVSLVKLGVRTYWLAQLTKEGLHQQ